MRKILITNDDGIGADGIIRLAAAATDFGEVWVVAPESQRSAASHSVSLRNPIDVWPVSFEVPGVRAYACSGTPADCVRVGALNVVTGGPDVLLSGINDGFNMASDLQYSATVGAALEGAFQKLHSIAFSEAVREEKSVTDANIKDILAELIDKPLGKNCIWNVNFPDCSREECRGILRDRKVSDDDFYHDHYNEVKNENGRISYMVEGVRSWDAKDGTDLRAVLDNYISIGIVNNLN